jgi:quercetin dioxygenase-like cupin family protein
MAAMKLRRIAWKDAAEPGENALRRTLEEEGFEVHTWRDPADRVYGEHRHDCDESLWVLRGSLVFQVKGRDYVLGPGDRLQLPAHVAHCATAGPDGATYLIGQRKEADQGRPTQRGVAGRSPSDWLS